MNKLTWLRHLYLFLTLIITTVLIHSLMMGGRIHTDLNSLLPQQQQTDPLWKAAQQAQNQQLNQQILLLIGAENQEHAIKSAEQLSKLWQNSQLFTHIEAQQTLDLTQLQSQIQALGVAALPTEQAQLLLQQPKEYFRSRAEAALNPFTPSLLPLHQDWLGFGRFVLDQSTNQAVQWDINSGFFITHTEGKTWVWIRAHLPPQIDQTALIKLLQQSRSQMQAQNITLLASGGILFSADTKAQAEYESLWMSLTGLSLTFLLIASLWRHWRLIALLLPLGIGIIFGFAACLMLFGHIHALTLVIGSSLIGVLVDFPLHWLAPTLFSQNWHAQQRMQRIAVTFAISLGITAFGYALLFFTPLPVLQETAVFSTAALFGAYSSTALLLPPLFKRFQIQHSTIPSLMTQLIHNIKRLLTLPNHIQNICLSLSLLFIVTGLWQSQWQDDIRDWTKLNPDLLTQAKHIALIAQQNPSATQLLVSAPDSEQLILRHRTLAQQFPNIDTLAKWALPPSEQAALKTQLRIISTQPSLYADLLAIGISETSIQQALHTAATMPEISLAQSLNPITATSAKPLYLGKIAGQELSLLRLNHSITEQDISHLQQILNCTNCIRALDNRQAVNDMFLSTRNQAAWLKLISIAAAGLLLWHLFGIKQGSLMLLIPLGAALVSIACLGWWHIPIGLFSMFGLLLAAAIGMDYTVYALSMDEPITHQCTALCLAASTSGISFLLLCFSQTSAVAAFGATVTLGIGFNLLFTLILLIKRANYEQSPI